MAAVPLLSTRCPHSHSAELIREQIQLLPVNPFGGHISHDAYLQARSSSWSTWFHGLNVTRPRAPHHEPPTHRITHDLQTHTHTHTHAVWSLIGTVHSGQFVCEAAEVLTHCKCFFDEGSSWTLQLV